MQSINQSKADEIRYLRHFHDTSFYSFLMFKSLWVVNSILVINWLKPWLSMGSAKYILLKLLHARWYVIKFSYFLCQIIHKNYNHSSGCKVHVYRVNRWVSKLPQEYPEGNRSSINRVVFLTSGMFFFIFWHNLEYIRFLVHSTQECLRFAMTWAFKYWCHETCLNEWKNL